MLIAIDEKTFQQFTQNNKFSEKDVLRKPSHNKLMFFIIHAE